MFIWRKREFTSLLFNERDFYGKFMSDLANCKNEVLIESPYMTSSRMKLLYPIFNRLLNRNVHIHIVTRDPVDHDDEHMKHQATNEILCCRELGINVVLLKGRHHRKLAVIDRSILWEGSLNILSYSNSLEIMRRIVDKKSACQMFTFLKLGELI